MNKVRVRKFVTENKIGLLLNLIAIIVCYGHLVFSQNVGIDTEVVINNPWDTVSWETLGRHGLLTTKFLIGNGWYNPYMAGVLFILAFALLGSFLAYLCYCASGENQKYPYGLFMVLFSVCPIWMTQFYFALQRPEIVLGMLYAAIAVAFVFHFLFENGRWWELVVSLIFGIWSFCSYQANVPLYIGLSIALLFLIIWNAKEEKKASYYWIKIAWIVGVFLVTYVANTLITKLCFTSSNYVEDQVAWGTMSAWDCARRCMGHVYSSLLWQKVYHISVYPLAAIASLILLVVVLRSKRSIGSKVLLCLCGLGLNLAPFLLTIYSGQTPTARSQCTMEFIAPFLCMALAGWCKENGRLCWKRVYWTEIGLSVVCLWVFASLIFRLEYTDDVRYAEDVQMAEEIATAIEALPDTEGKPIIVYGHHDARLNSACLETDIFGYSYFEAGYSPDNQTGATIRISRFLNYLGYDYEDGYSLGYSEIAYLAAPSMSVWPAEDSIRVGENCIVIKLSEE